MTDSPSKLINNAAKRLKPALKPAQTVGVAVTLANEPDATRDRSMGNLTRSAPLNLQAPGQPGKSKG